MLRVSVFTPCDATPIFVSSPMLSNSPLAPSSWVEKYVDSPFNHAILRVNDREVARDLVQETFLSALQNLSSFREESSAKTWLFAILKNKIIDHYRRRATESKSPLPEEDEAIRLDEYFDEEGEWKASAGCLCRPRERDGAPGRKACR